jgi:hypothetical protein
MLQSMRTVLLAMFGMVTFTAGTAGGCKDSAPAQTAPTVASPTPSGSAGSTTTFTTSGADVCVFVADVKSKCVTPEQIKAWPRIDSLLPADARRMGTWKSIAVQTLAGRGQDLMQPTDTYPDMVAALFVGPNGKPALGMFDLVELTNRGLPKWQQSDVTEIHVLVASGNGRGENDDGNSAIGDPNALTLTFVVNGTATKVTGKQLLAIPREGQPGEEGDAKGWKLSTIMKAQKLAVPSRVRLTDAAGVNLTLEKADFDESSSIPFVKLNKQGQLRFRILKKKGDAWTKGADLRALTQIEMLK